MQPPHLALSPHWGIYRSGVLAVNPLAIDQLTRPLIDGFIAAWVVVSGWVSDGVFGVPGGIDLLVFFQSARSGPPRHAMGMQLG